MILVTVGMQAHALRRVTRYGRSVRVGGVVRGPRGVGECTRATDGVVLAPGEFGDCRYAEPMR